MGIGPLMAGIREKDRWLAWIATPLIVTTFISSFSPFDSRLHTAVGIGPLIVVVRQEDRKFSRDTTIFFPVTTHLSLEAAALSGLDPLAAFVSNSEI